jgi:serine/threonine protein kinase
MKEVWLGDEHKTSCRCCHCESNKGVCETFRLIRNPRFTLLLSHSIKFDNFKKYSILKVMNFSHNERTNISVQGNVFTKHTKLQYALNEILLYNLLTNDYIIKPTKIWLEQTGSQVEAYFSFPYYAQCCSSSLARDLIMALYYLEQTKIVHNDLKITNVVFDKQANKHKLIDFGNAKTLSCSENSIGTYYISSPEVLLRNASYKWRKDPFFEKFNKPIGTVSDMWSMACVIYEHFTGIPLVTFRNGVYPYTADQALEAIKELFITRSSEILKKIESLPGDLPYIIKKTFVIDPERRSTASSFIPSPHTVKVLKCNTFRPETEREIEFVKMVEGTYDNLPVKVKETDRRKIINLATKYATIKTGYRLPIDYLVVACIWLTRGFCVHSTSIEEVAGIFKFDAEDLASAIVDLLTTVDFCFFIEDTPLFTSYESNFLL